jgi:pilus assembly protein CpaF
VTGLEGNQIVMQDIFVFRQTGVAENGKILGHFEPTGSVPTWFDTLSGMGLSIDPKMFDPDFKGDVKLTGRMRK